MLITLPKRHRRTIISCAIFLTAISLLLILASLITPVITENAKVEKEQRLKLQLQHELAKNLTFNPSAKFATGKRPMDGNKCLQNIGKAFPHAGGYGCREQCTRDGIPRKSFARAFYSPYHENSKESADSDHLGWPEDFISKVKTSLRVMQEFGLTSKDILWIPRFKDIVWSSNATENAQIPSGPLHITGSYHCCLSGSEIAVIAQSWSKSIEFTLKSERLDERFGPAIKFAKFSCALERPGIISLSLLLSKPSEFLVNTWLDKLQSGAIKQIKLNGEKWNSRNHNLVRGHENRIVFALIKVQDNINTFGKLYDIIPGRFAVEYAVDAINDLAMKDGWTNTDIRVGVPELRK